MKSIRNFHSGSPTKRCQSVRREKGSSLVVSLLMLVVILMLGIAATRMALQSEMGSRGDRDRQIAYQAAEAALLDAEMDIENSPSVNSRSNMFSEKPLKENFVSGCGKAADGLLYGLCARGTDENPVWLTVDFNMTGAESRTVPFGRYTGQTMQTGSGMQPVKLPRYIIELIDYRKPGEGTSRESKNYFYRVTAVGFGPNDKTKVMLQSLYRKIDR